jgi:hypothetical protein
MVHTNSPNDSQVPPISVEDHAGAAPMPPAEKESRQTNTLGLVEFITVGETDLQSLQHRRLEFGVRLSCPIPLEHSEELMTAVTKIRDQVREILGTDPATRKLVKKISDLRWEQSRLQDSLKQLQLKLARAQSNWQAASKFLQLHGVEPEAFSFEIAIPSGENCQAKNKDGGDSDTVLPF